MEEKNHTYLALFLVIALLALTPLTVYLATQSTIFLFPRAKQASASLALHPNQGQVHLGQVFEIVVKAVSPEQPLTHLESLLFYEPTIFQLTGTPLPGEAFETVKLNDTFSNPGVVRLSANGSLLGSADLVRLRFTPVKAGQAEIRLEGVGDRNEKLTSQKALFVIAP